MLDSAYLGFPLCALISQSFCRFLHGPQRFRIFLSQTLRNCLPAVAEMANIIVTRTSNRERRVTHSILQ